MRRMLLLAILVLAGLGPGSASAADGSPSANGDWLSLLSGAVFLTAAVFCLALFLGGGRQRAYLLFGLHLLTCLGGIVLRSTFVRENVPGPVLPALEPLADSMLPIGGVLLIAFFVRMLSVPSRRAHYALAVPASVLPGLLLGAPGTIYVVLAYVLGLLAWAIARRRPGAIPSAIGVLIMTAGTTALFLRVRHSEYLNVAGLILFIFAIAISTSRQLRSQNLEHEAARMRSARLEADLLKRSIQPHFLMNTLLSVMSWIGRDPETAGKLIQALANEFRQVNRMAAKTSVPLSQEIQLCRTHLELMGYRHDASYRLVAEGLPDVEVPPLVLHTLIENGLTHALASGENGIFTLRGKTDGDSLRLTLRNGGSRLDKLGRQSPEEIEEGFGLRYVRSRLEESFPGRWALDYRLDHGTWETSLRIPLPEGHDGARRRGVLAPETSPEVARG